MCNFTTYGIFELCQISVNVADYVYSIVSLHVYKLYGHAHLIPTFISLSSVCVQLGCL